MRYADNYREAEAERMAVYRAEAEAERSAQLRANAEFQREQRVAEQHARAARMARAADLERQLVAMRADARQLAFVVDDWDCQSREAHRPQLAEAEAEIQRLEELIATLTRGD